MSEYIRKQLQMPLQPNNHGGWTINPDYLDTIQTTIEESLPEEELYADVPQWETIQMVLLALPDIPSVQGEVQLRPEVKWFAEQMELTLRANDHKGGWSHMDYDDLMCRLSEEVEELYELQGTETSNEFVIREATDVANFAMMIGDLVRRSSPQSEKGEEGR